MWHFTQKAEEEKNRVAKAGRWITACLKVKNSDQLAALEVKSGIIRVIRIHPLGSTNVCIKFHTNESERRRGISARTEASEADGRLKKKKNPDKRAGVRETRDMERVCYMSVCRSTGCTPDEQMLQLPLVTHINREQMATQVAAEGEREGERGRGREGEREREDGSHKQDVMEIDVLANRRICLEKRTDETFTPVLSGDKVD